jgi:hypothetical protein
MKNVPAAVPRRSDRPGASRPVPCPAATAEGSMRDWEDATGRGPPIRPTIPAQFLPHESAKRRQHETGDRSPVFGVAIIRRTAHRPALSRVFVLSCFRDDVPAGAGTELRALHLQPGPGCAGRRSGPGLRGSDGLRPAPEASGPRAVHSSRKHERTRTRNRRGLSTIGVSARSRAPAPTGTRWGPVHPPATQFGPSASRLRRPAGRVGPSGVASRRGVTWIRKKRRMMTPASKPVRLQPDRIDARPGPDRVRARRKPDRQDSRHRNEGR